MLSACFEPCSDHGLRFKNKPWELTFWRKIVYPFFILCGNGSVYCMVTGLGQHRPPKPQVMGPIPMLPQTDDNYGQESCAILCLHPLVSSPPILVIADR